MIYRPLDLGKPLCLLKEELVPRGVHYKIVSQCSVQTRITSVRCHPLRDNVLRHQLTIFALTNSHMHAILSIMLLP